MIKPFTRWTADTEHAFLLALRLKGQVRLAAEEIGRAVGAAYNRKRRHPDFAARWDRIVADQQAAWAESSRSSDAVSEARVRGAAGRAHFDGWTPIRRRAFLRALSETGHVRQACECVRMSNTAAYKLRQASPEFAAAWDAALARSVPMLEQVAYERAVEGWDEPIVYGGKIVGTRRRYSESLLRLLLVRSGRTATPAAGPVEVAAPGSDAVMRAHAAARAAGGIFDNSATAEQTDARLRKQLDGLALRLRRDAEARGIDAMSGDEREAMTVLGIDPSRHPR